MTARGVDALAAVLRSGLGPLAARLQPRGWRRCTLEQVGACTGSCSLRERLDSSPGESLAQPLPRAVGRVHDGLGLAGRSDTYVASRSCGCPGGPAPSIEMRTGRHSVQ